MSRLFPLRPLSNCSFVVCLIWFSLLLWRTKQNDQNDILLLADSLKKLTLWNDLQHDFEVIEHGRNNHSQRLLVASSAFSKGLGKSLMKGTYIINELPSTMKSLETFSLEISWSTSRACLATCACSFDSSGIDIVLERVALAIR